MFSNELTEEQKEELKNRPIPRILNYYPMDKSKLLKDEEYIVKKEKVMVFNSSIIKNNYNFQGVVSGEDVEIISGEVFKPQNLLYIDRDVAEKDFNYKQIIPYCIFTKGDLVFVYERSKSGSETRLHNLLSIGVGGHINPCDGNSVEAVNSACKREIMEEVSFLTEDQITPIALINDDSDEVNSVHFGVVYHIKLNQDSIFIPVDKALSNGTFKTFDELLLDESRIEKWSKLVISIIK
jgi:predicted NUDIX family phosphoesterase